MSGFAVGMAFVGAACGSDTSTSGGSSSGGDGGSSTSSSSGGSSSSSGAVSTCTSKYCCSFDGTIADCVVDNADVQAFAIDPAWLDRSRSVSPPGSMHIEVVGTFASIDDASLRVVPKQAAGKRVEIEFSLYTQYSNTASVFQVKGGASSFTIVLSAFTLRFDDENGTSLGLINTSEWYKVTVFIDPTTSKYGATLEGNAPVTRDMAAAWTDVSEIRIGTTSVSSSVSSYYDDVRVNWN